ncbi:hypothetical protein GF376_04345 [Candidatus Peregrinibacteria bacterium]|nr:hypothetical protein [Candidatus Peregrinibacteria bacterium]
MSKQTKILKDKTYYIEGNDSEQPVKTLRESEIHESVFEENLDANQKEGDPYLKAVFSWIAPEYLQHPKSTTWWVMAGFIFLIAIILEAVTGNWTMLLATVTFAVVYYVVHEHAPPKHTKVVISEMGIKVGHQKIPYSEIESFWILYDPPYLKRLNIRTKKSFFADLVIELENEDPSEIKEFLSQYIIEIPDKKEHLTDTILRILKL